MSAHTTVAFKRFRGCLFAAVMTPLVLFGCGGGGGGGSAGVSLAQVVVVDRPPFRLAQPRCLRERLARSRSV